MDKADEAAPGKHRTAEQALSYATAPIGRTEQSYSYSNPSYVLLGMLIEKVTGQPLATVLRRDLAAPAGLSTPPSRAARSRSRRSRSTRIPSCGKANDGYLPCRAIASLSARTAGLAVDAPTVARWGYSCTAAACSRRSWSAR